VRRLLAEQKGEQVVHLVGRDRFAECRGHERSFRLLPISNLVYRHSHLFRRQIRQDELRAFFAAEETGDDAAVAFRHREQPEGSVHVAVRVENVFAPAADPVDPATSERENVSGGIALDPARIRDNFTSRGSG